VSVKKGGQSSVTRFAPSRLDCQRLSAQRSLHYQEERSELVHEHRSSPGGSIMAESPARHAPVGIKHYRRIATRYDKLAEADPT
jgi:hypothetical protein